MLTKLYCAMGYQCNNNCLICVVNAFKNRHKNMTTQQVLQLFEKIKEEKHLQEVEFSGGEPTVRDDFLYLLKWVSSKYPYLSFSLLTNGRKFYNPVFSREFSKYNIRHVITALHHFKEEKHDELTQAKRSFKETCTGIKNLSELGINLTLKIIVTKLNYRAMPQIVEFIAKNFPNVKNISINGLDIRERAKQYKDKVIISFTDYVYYLQKAIDTANKYNINMVLYSVPLCVLDKKYQIYAGPQPDLISLYKSPSNEIKNKTEEHGYMPECKKCKLNKECYGTWFSYFDEFGTGELKIQKERQNTFFIDINRTCNSNCIFCSEFRSRPKKDISFEKLKQKIDSLKIGNKDNVIISGEEPTLCPCIIPLIKYIQKHSKNINMCSDAIKLSDMDFCKDLIKAGIEIFCIPIHTPNSDLHDKITQTKNSFEKTINGIKNLVKCKCKNIIIKIPIQKTNYIYIKEIVKFAYRNFKNFNILFTFVNINGAAIKNKDKISISAGKVAPYLDEAIEFCLSKNIIFNIERFPVCVLKNKNLNITIRQNNIIRTDENKTDGFNDNVICKTCSYYKTKCTGVWSSYIKKYGIGEFRPLLNNNKYESNTK